MIRSAPSSKCSSTNQLLLLVLLLLVDQEQLQAFLADVGLHVAAASVSLLLWLAVLSHAVLVLLGLVGLAGHLDLTVCPDGSHPPLRIALVVDLVREVGVRLYTQIRSQRQSAACGNNRLERR